MYWWFLTARMGLRFDIDGQGGILMEHRILTEAMLGHFVEHLRLEEKSEATIEKYQRDVWAFWKWLPADKTIEKKQVIAYKHWLQAQYAVSTVNSVLAAVNGLMLFYQWNDCRVKQLKIQRQMFCDERKELTRKEYGRLLQTAREQGQNRLWLVIQTIGATGIRIGELQNITVEAVNAGRAQVTSKGKSRTVFLPHPLTKLLKQYIQKQQLHHGPVFVSRTGLPLNRSNIWRSMKTLCVQAGIAAQKVFPHNLRHLFARSFYALEKDIMKLADILGHSSVDTTRIYTISSGLEHARQIEQLNLVDEIHDKFVRYTT